MKYIVIYCCILLPITAFSQEVRNARWWVNKSNIEKSEFVSGYLYAASIFHEYYSQRKFNEAKTELDTIIARILYEHDKDALGLMPNISINTIVKELNKIYSDSRNMLLELGDALVVVKMELENGSRKDIEDKLNKFRNRMR